ncbi:MAG: phasin family protein [Neomegalonema sp.]|nr:phasin family protein [Neomegalonema sp.]
MAKENNFEGYAADAQKAFTEQSAQMAARFEEVADFTKGNVDAMFASATKATESMKEIATQMLGFARASMEANMAALKDLSQSKDPSEFMERQSSIAKATMESFADQARKLNEMTMAAAKECSEPVNARMAAVSEMVKSGAYKG